MLHKNPLYNIINWTDETINKIFTMFIDEYSDADRIKLEEKHTTIEQKRTFLINEQKKFDKSFK